MRQGSVRRLRRPQHYNAVCMRKKLLLLLTGLWLSLVVPAALQSADEPKGEQTPTPSSATPPSSSTAPKRLVPDESVLPGKKPEEKPAIPAVPPSLPPQPLPPKDPSTIRCSR